MRRRTTIIIALLLIALLVAGVVNLFQIRNAKGLQSITANPGNVTSQPIPPCRPGDVVFVVSLSQPAQREISVSYATADGSAVAGRDYVAASGTLTFGLHNRDELICVGRPSPTTPAPASTFVMRLSNPVGALLRTAQVTGTISASAD
jgi:hypothetical protein